MLKDKLIIAKKIFSSRLIVGTGKYSSMSQCAKAIRISGAEIVTVAVRRVNITNKKKPLLMDYIDPKKIRKVKEVSKEVETLGPIIGYLSEEVAI